MNFSEYINENKYGLSGEYGDTPEEVEDTLKSCRQAHKLNSDLIKELEGAIKIIGRIPDEWASLPGYDTEVLHNIEDALKWAKKYGNQWGRAIREMESELK